MIPLRLGPALDRDTFADVRRAMELEHFKWDVQVGDVAALAPFPIVIDRAAWDTLSRLSTALAREVLAVEREVVGRIDLQRRLAIPRSLVGRLRFAEAPRVMRFDFHYTPDGWRISEVNSDVPGGFTEATHFTRRMCALLGGEPTGDPTRALVEAIARVTDRVHLIVAPGHMEDHQVVAHLAAQLRAHGLTADIVAPDAARDLVIRFFPIDRLGWHPLCDGLVVNPTSCAISESKRLPLIWDELATRTSTWRALLPETRALGPWMLDPRWLIKSAYCDTGETVASRGDKLWPKRALRAVLKPREWIAQRKFENVPLAGMHACIGVYVIDGAVAGAYARITEHSNIDYRALDAALVLA